MTITQIAFGRWQVTHNDCDMRYLQDQVHLVPICRLLCLHPLIPVLRIPQKRWDPFLQMFYSTGSPAVLFAPGVCCNQKGSVTKILPGSPKLLRTCRHMCRSFT